MKSIFLFAFMLICVPVVAEFPAYLERMPPPDTVYLTPDIDSFPPLYEGDRGGSFGSWTFSALSVAGLAALHAREEGGDALVWIHSPGLQSYSIMLDDILERTGARRETLPSLEALVRLGVDRGWVKGYILYRDDGSGRNPYDAVDLADPTYNNSVNVATSLAAGLGGILVEERAEPAFRVLGLALLLDARDKDESWLLEHHVEQCSRKHLHLLDPKAPHMRDYAIATRSLCVFGVTPHVEEALLRLEPNAPTLGWNAGDEHQFVAQLSRCAHFTTASNWIMNLPVMSCVEAGRHVSWEELQVNRKSQTDPLALDWPEDTRYTSFVLSDGDNVQWFTGNFASPPGAYWRAENRGAFPFGWTMPVSHLSQVAPSMLAHLARTATANDQALTFPSGYYYPDAYGQQRGGDVDWYAERVAMFGSRLGRLGMRVIINIAEDWAGVGAMSAYEQFAKQTPDIAGIMAMQYHPYNAGLGAIRWVEDARGRPVPVVSPRFAIWSGMSRLTNNGPPARIAALINEQPHAGLPDSMDHFDWTIVHAWSHFQRVDADVDDPLAEEMPEKRPVSQDAFVRNGYEPAWWCVKRLQPHVRVVSPEELMWRIRIQLRPAETLDALAEDAMAAPDTSAHQRALLETYRDRLARADLDQAEQARAAYWLLQDIHWAKLLVPADLPDDPGAYAARR